MPLAGKTMIDHIPDRLPLPVRRRSSASSAIWATRIETYAGERYDVPDALVVQPEMRGQAHAIALTREWVVQGDALVMSADTVFEADFSSPAYAARPGDRRRDLRQGDRRSTPLGITRDRRAGALATQLVEKPGESAIESRACRHQPFRRHEHRFSAIDELIASGRMTKGEYYRLTRCRC
ncbi:MAG: sugar phosphate nucleotidyltransferase [Chloroflexia bacterium]